MKYLGLWSPGPRSYFKNVRPSPPPLPPPSHQQKVAQYKHNGYHDHAIKITVHDVWRNNCLLLQKSCDLKKT